MRRGLSDLKTDFSRSSASLCCMTSPDQRLLADFPGVERLAADFLFALGARACVLMHVSGALFVPSRRRYVLGFRAF